MNQPGTNQHAMQAEVHQVAGLIQSRMCSEFQMHEECIPAAKAAARCSIFVTQDWHENPRLCVFMQHGAGVTPGLWAIPPPPSSHQGSPASIQAFSHSLASMSLIPYIKAARKSGYAVLVMNPSTNRMSVQGHSVKILHSSSPEEHVRHVWTTYIQPSAASLIHFISHDTSGLLVNHLLSHLDPRLHPLLARRGVHFEPSAEPMFQLVTTGASARYCSTLSVGRLSSENSSCLLQSVQSSTFVFLKCIPSGLQPALQAIRTTVPNKLVVTVNRARLTGQPYNNPYAVVTCVGQSKATVGNNKKTMDPEWNQTFSFPVRDETASVLVKVKDKAFLPMSSMVGGVAVALADVGWNRVWRQWFTLRHDTSSQHQYHQVHGNGEIELTLEWVHDTFVARTDSFLAPPLSPPLASVAQDNGCYLCSCTFVLHRRRYCRLCLRAVCVSCSDRLFLPGFSEAKRVCLACCNLQIALHKQPPPMPPRPIQPAPRPHREADVRREADKAALEDASRANLQAMMQREQEARPLGIDDFDLIKVVGRGAFGKVMLVRKKNGKNAGAIYAMKILKKMHIIQNDQVENTKAEQHILKEINHPYVVRLRYAFQNPDKLYLVMDYYPGGSMYFHLKKSKRFSEERTRLYMAQLLTAIMHLHSKDIAYRDLKLENILMDTHGHIALTDFGLSKEGQTIDGAIRASQAN
ncbi:hypothetical protein DYB38_009529, partial [Aphanomyces astaci]